MLFKMYNPSSWEAMSWPLSVVSCCVYQATCLALKSPPSIILGWLFNACRSVV